MNQNMKEEEMKKRNLALKSSTIEDSSSDSTEDVEDDKEMAVIIRRFIRFIRKKKRINLDNIEKIIPH